MKLTPLFLSIFLFSPTISNASIMTNHGPSTVPSTDAKRFCKENKSFCTPKGPKRIELDATRLKFLNYVNKIVNDGIASADDMTIYGVEEHWAIPTKAGDCEDYAILKKKLLMEAGWPSASLLITAVWYTPGGPLPDVGHAILTVTTDKGDFILDNRNDDIKDYRETGYKFVMRQSQTGHGWDRVD